MKLKWKVNGSEAESEYDGCELSEQETQLLMRLAGTLTHDSLLEKGFTSEEALIIQRWWNAI